MEKGDFTALCILAAMCCTMLLIGASGGLMTNPESSQSKCEAKGGIWYTPRSAPYICIDKKMTIDVEK